MGTLDTEQVKQIVSSVRDGVNRLGVAASYTNEAERLVRAALAPHTDEPEDTRTPAERYADERVEAIFGDRDSATVSRNEAYNALAFAYAAGVLGDEDEDD